MSDNVTLPGTGGIVSAEEVTTLNGAAVATGEKAQRVVPSLCTGDGTLVDVSEDGPMPVADAVLLEALGDLATKAKQDAEAALIGAVDETAPNDDTASSGLNGRLQRIAQRITSLINLLPTALGGHGGLKIEGVASGTTVPVSGTVAVTGAGDATAANQTAHSTLFGAINETAPNSDTASSGLNGRLQRIAQRITSLINLLPAALGVGGGLKVDGSGTALPVTGSLSTTPAASELHLGEVGGNMPQTILVEFTRESNATPYTAGDVISASAGTPAVFEIPLIARVTGGSFYLPGLRVIFNVKSVTPRLRIHFYNSSSVTVSGDNLPHQEKYADVAKRLGYIDLPVMITGADTANSDMSRTQMNTQMFPLVAAPGTRSVYGLIETLDAVTLTSGSKVTIAALPDNN